MESVISAVISVIMEEGHVGFIGTRYTHTDPSVRRRYVEIQCASKIPLEILPWERTRNLMTEMISLLYLRLVISNYP